MSITQRAAHLQPVAPADLQEYPIARNERLPELAFIKWVPSRWLNSSGHLKCTYEVQGMALSLFFLASAQSPIGTLPDDNEELAALLRVPQAHFSALRALGDRGPLRNWVRCTSDGEVRLMHHVVAEAMQDVLTRRETRQLSKEAQAERKRYERLAEGLMRAGLCREATEDGVLMNRMDQWLAATCKGNRTAIAYQRAIEQAVRERWIASPKG